NYVLDLWFEKCFKKNCRGKAHLVLYCDDFIACFENQEDARNFLSALAERLAGFSLEVEPSKTAMLRFGSEALREGLKDGLNRPQTFKLLCITQYDIISI